MAAWAPCGANKEIFSKCKGYLNNLYKEQTKNWEKIDFNLQSLIKGAHTSYHL